MTPAVRHSALPDIPAARHVLIAGPTASGKSALALDLAERQGGVIVNADASQVYSCWRVLTARPSRQEEARAPHALYGHVAFDRDYSAGHWLREVAGLLAGGERLIVTGGTGLYFRALTEGMADIPPVPAEIRAEADAMPLPALLAAIDPATAGGIDRANRARVQRAFEVERATGRALHLWQAETPPPLLPRADATALVVETGPERLAQHIAARFDAMLAGGALEEARAVEAVYHPARPAFRAIGAAELIAHLRGEIQLHEARDRATLATRQFAKRQRTWFRARMRDWRRIAVS